MQCTIVVFCLIFYNPHIMLRLGLQSKLGKGKNNGRRLVVIEFYDYRFILDGSEFGFPYMIKCVTRKNQPEVL